MISLKRRLSWGLMLSLVLLLVLQWGVATYAVSRLAEDQLVNRLAQEGESLLAALAFDTQGRMQVDSQRMSAVYQRPFSGRYYLLLSGEHQVFSRSLWDTRLTIGAIPPGRQQQFRLDGPDHQPLLVVAQGYKKQKHAITIAIAEDMTALEAGIARFQLLYAMVSATGLAALLLVQRMIVLSALRPLQAIRENIARLGRGEADQVDAHGPEEIMPLIDELNRLLAGIARKAKRSREALGNLAHALKTRLTLLNQIAEHPEISTRPDIRRTLYSATEAIGHIVERELKRARLIGDLHPGRRISLHDEVAQLAYTLRLLYADKGVNINWEIDTDAIFRGDQEDLLEMLGNLLDNACKWCHGNVSLTAIGSEPLCIVVEDDGPGCPAEGLDELIRRGYRADESKSGSGLGLAIVHDIVDGYQGELIFGRSPAMGGLRVEIRISTFNTLTTPA